MFRASLAKSSDFTLLQRGGLFNFAQTDVHEMMVGFLIGASMTVLRFVSAVWRMLRSPLVGPLHGSNPTAGARALALQHLRSNDS
jgi:hypothetical protein